MWDIKYLVSALKSILHLLSSIRDFQVWTISLFADCCEVLVLFEDSTRHFKAAHGVIFSAVQHRQTVCRGALTLIWPRRPQTGNLWAPMNFWFCRSTARGCVTVWWEGGHVRSEACLLGIFLLFQYLLSWNQSVFYGSVGKEREMKQASGPWGIFLPTAVGWLTKMMGSWVRWVVLWKWMDARLDAVLTQRFPKDGTCASCGIWACPCIRIVLPCWECG